MKKLITLFLAGMMLFTLCACEKTETVAEKEARLKRQMQEAQLKADEANFEYLQIEKARRDIEQALKELENAK